MAPAVRLRSFPFLLLALAIALAACGPRPGGTTTTIPGSPGGRITLTGAGATFPFPLYSRWFAEYSKVSNTDVNYQSIGSGGGIRQIIQRTVDFGASDGTMTPEQEAAAPGKVLHIPSTMGAVAVVYNLPGIGPGLKLTPDALAGIYLKKITRWNDQRVAAANPGVALPALDIAVVHRSDGSGTTFIFTNYLSKVSQEWKDRVGNATSVNWPGDIGGQGNEGVAGQVQQIRGAIGYVELAYAIQNGMAYASIRNRAGNFVAPSLEATTAAAEGVALPADMKVMITDSANAAAYPVSGFTWLLVSQEQANPIKGKAVVDMLWWAVHEGQRYAAPLLYAPLSADAVARAETLIDSMVHQGIPLRK
ncbi:MAG: phosphate ABC transporter substrate-binding protein PstS [Chloroflexi bacterium]|nr:phosphate ABC transporter substrate-binding protein PstS [Chloroflexota bacterium]